MLKYLIIQLDDSSLSFCHYTNPKKQNRLIALDKLEKAIVWAMKGNLSIQYLYPSYILPEEYTKTINKSYHVDIVSDSCEDNRLVKDADIVVFNDWKYLANYSLTSNQAYVIRTSFKSLFDNVESLGSCLHKMARLNVVVTDVEEFSKENEYQTFLNTISLSVAKEYQRGHNVHLNFLTDRIFINSMNNCNAGNETITVAPDGKFYICPAFYTESNEVSSLGDINSGLNIKNQQLYRLDHAPICRNCDAFQCRRCIWLNRKLTMEVNTPGRQQCVMAHLERNASKNLIDTFHNLGITLPTVEITPIAYLDPFDNITKK